MDYCLANTYIPQILETGSLLRVAGHSVDKQTMRKENGDDFFLN